DLAPPDGDALPEWMSDAMQYFTLVEGGEGWKRLIGLWLEFEKANYLQDSSNRLPTKHRPDEVRIWMKNHCLYEKLPKIKSPSQFSVAWRKWWISLQPSSRTKGDVTLWPLPQNEPVDATEWGSVARGGCNGFFLVVLTLAWWMWAALNENTSTSTIVEALEDVSWVCEVITRYVHEGRRQAGTGIADNGDSERPNKRARVD
ncbi:uncharacterized protein TRAVEDRAFT_123156, partial [Trametes versicolor FP-101664 SS1]|uniref:uncharacterized protein n=1 Tax=Trametes versicolor (strain FP-101664) TaxID=717944 RepID=UPI0004622706